MCSLTCSGGLQFKKSIHVQGVSCGGVCDDCYCCNCYLNGDGDDNGGAIIKLLVVAMVMEIVVIMMIMIVMQRRMVRMTSNGIVVMMKIMTKTTH